MLSVINFRVTMGSARAQDPARVSWSKGKVISGSDKCVCVDQSSLIRVLCREQGAWHPLKEQDLDGFHSDKTLRHMSRQEVDDPILQVRKLRCTEAGSAGTDGPGHSPYAASRGPAALGHVTRPPTKLGQTTPLASSPQFLSVETPPRQTLRASVPTCNSSKIPDTHLSPSSLLPTATHNLWTSGKSALSCPRPCALPAKETQDPEC